MQFGGAIEGGVILSCHSPRPSERAISSFGNRNAGVRFLYTRRNFFSYSFSCVLKKYLVSPPAANRAPLERRAPRNRHCSADGGRFHPTRRQSSGGRNSSATMVEQPTRHTHARFERARRGGRRCSHFVGGHHRNSAHAEMAEGSSVKAATVTSARKVGALHTR